MDENNKKPEPPKGKSDDKNKKYLNFLEMVIRSQI